MTTRFLPACLAALALAVPASADPQISSWITSASSQYARIYTSDANKLAGATATTWTNGRNAQSLPAYAGVQGVATSASWLYLTTSDLGPYVMGPWYNDATRTTAFVNLPVNQSIIYRFPRTSTLGTPPATKSSTQGMEDSVGFFVDGVSLFDPTDGFSYANGTEASPGTGQWHRDAYVNEAITFDPGNTHQQNTGKYHNHANPLALRYLLGDHVDFNPSTKAYRESTSTTLKHSPILGWMRDGYPIYGPYGYASALDATSAVRRMVGGFVKRDGTTAGVDTLSTTRTLPVWATRNNGGISAAGPAVSTTYPLGRYIEDWAYLGDLTKPSTGAKYQLGTDFDLNEYNVRYCVTPEFPGGTYAYFINLSASGTPQFPCNSNRYFFGNPTGGTTTIAETVTTQFKGGANLQEAARVEAINAASGNVTLSWSSVEGGTYKVEASPDLASWSPLSTTQAATSDASQTTYTESAGALSPAQRFYRVTRTALASYDGDGTVVAAAEGISTVSPVSGSRGTTATLTVTLNSGYDPAPPPSTVTPTSAALTRTGATTLNATTYTRNSTTGIVTLTFTLPAGATVGAYTVGVTFGPNTWSKSNAFTVN